MSTRPKPAGKAPRRRRAAGAATLDLALQGGGSHGAFTWGVLDTLLDDDTLTLDGVSGTSAGALNAAVLATGWAEGGRAGAQQALRNFWLDVAGQRACFGGNEQRHPGVTSPFAGSALATNPMQAWLQLFVRTFSPYQFNPFGLNPLRDVVERHVQLPALRRSPVSVFITATAVRSGQPRVFQRDDVSIDALLASACLPQLFQAVEVDGEPYWDGGYSGNPAIWPLIYETQSLDVLLVKINPLLRPELPRTADEIADRVNEITFNASLVAEMRAIGFVQRLVQQGALAEGSYRNLRLHMVADEDQLGHLHSSSKLSTDLGFIQRLHGMGRAAAERWLAVHRADIGRRSSMDPAATFLAPRSGR